MCGICGILSFTLLSDADLDSVTAMNTSLIHRGPDGEGTYFDEKVALAMRRLSIIDLLGGWQPLFNEDGNLVLIVNGEIYNYIEIRKLLEQRGHTFSTKSDSETILHLYEDFGEQCIHHLRGMFAFVLYDRKNKRIMIARDRMGEKPLYLFKTKDKIIFSSELKSLLRSHQIPFILDPDAINLYFHYQYVPEPRTPIKNVNKLPAGHYIIIDLDTMRCTKTCYWRMENAKPLAGDPSGHIRAILDEVSELTIRADVPVGIALSGGLDSSAIAALAVTKYPDTIQAFSIGYPDYPECDERRDALQFAEFLGMPFHDVELKTQDLVSIFPDLVYYRDDPIADISGYGYYAVMKLARDHGVPVMLQGQGGDELFFGYPWVQEAVRQSIRKELIKTKKKSIYSQYLNFTFPNLTSPYEILHWVQTFGGLKTGWNEYQRDRLMPENQLVFMDLIHDFNVAEQSCDELYPGPFKQQIARELPYSLFKAHKPWKNIDILMTRLISETYLLGNGITQGDRLSMASSVELRLPLVDFRLIEAIVGLRKTHSDYYLEPKCWLKSALKDNVPEWILSRPKRGFTPPVREWHHALFERYGSLLDDGRLCNFGVLKQEYAKKMAKGTFPRDNIVPLSFKALILEIWCRNITDKISSEI